MPNLLSNRIQRNKLQPGDHIYSYRNLHIYSHHGIYIGNNEVIHFTRTKRSMLNVSHDCCEDFWESCNPNYVEVRCCEACGFKPREHRGVVKTCLDCFLRGHELYICEYEVSQYHKYLKRPGTCNTIPSLHPHIVVQNAVSKLDGKFWDYDVVHRNCESFAVLSKTGHARSFQSESYMLHKVDNVLNKLKGNHNN